MFLRNLGRLFLLLLVVLAAYGIYKLMPLWQPKPEQESFVHRTETVVTPLAPISRGDILSQFKLITVERQYRIPVKGTTYKPMPSPEKDGAWGNLSQGIFGKMKRVPGTTQNLVYEMVTTATAGLDLSRLQESDIVNGDRETTITLPRPEIISIVHDTASSRIYSEDRPALPFIGNPAGLLQEMQRKGEQRHREEAMTDEGLLLKAQRSAQDNLGRFLKGLHPGREINFLFKEPEQKRESTPVPVVQRSS